MNIAVVGGAGYVGSVLVRELLKDHSVSVFDLGLYGFHGLPWTPEIYDAKDAAPDWFERVDAVVNLAGFSNDPIAEFLPDLNWEYNVTTAAKVAWAAKEAGVKRLIYASSCSLYHSVSSEFDAEVTENHPVYPQWHYSASKYAGELASLAFNSD